MRHDRKLAVGTIATAAVLLGGVSDAPQAGQARGSLGVTVKVIAACSASLGSSGTVTTGFAPPRARPSRWRARRHQLGLAALALPPPASRPGTTWSTSPCSTEAGPAAARYRGRLKFLLPVESRRGYSWSQHGVDGSHPDPCSFWLGAPCSPRSAPRWRPDAVPRRPSRSPPGWPICGRRRAGKGSIAARWMRRLPASARSHRWSRPTGVSPSGG
jgi:hypothetical protein